MSPRHREELKQAGVSIADYLGDGRWLAEIPERSDAQVAGLPLVRAVRPWNTDPRVDGAFGTRPLRDVSRLALRSSGRARAVVTLVKGATESEVKGVLAAVTAAGGSVAWSVAVGGNLTIGAELPIRLGATLASHGAVLMVEEAPDPTLRNDSVRWVVQSGTPLSTPVWDRGLSGAGEVLGIIDDPIDIAHCSFLDPDHPVGPSHRKVVAYNAAPATPGSLFNTHGTHVAGIAAGDAGDSSATRGLAYGARLAYSPVPAFEAGPMSATLGLHASQGAFIHTNSWGDESAWWYTAFCRSIDDFAYENEDHLVIFAVTNENELRTPENAKNVLAVAASRDEPNFENWCTGGIGPTVDGRRKPELCAPGCGVSSANALSSCGVTTLSGTSMAAPAVAAAAALVREYFRAGFHPGGASGSGPSFVPTGSLLRAMIINATVDLAGLAGNPGRREGYGRIVLDRSLHFSGDSRALVVRDVRHAQGLQTGDFADVVFTVGQNVDAGSLLVTLAWADPPAAPGALSAIVNDLDLECVSPSGAVYIGGAFADGASVPWEWGQVGQPDRVNTVEHIIIPEGTAEPGVWRVRVKGTAVNIGPQGFAVAITGDVAEANDPGSAVAVVPAPASRIPGEATPISASVRLAPGVTVAPGGVRLKQRSGPGSAWTTSIMTPDGPGRWRLTLLPAVCADEPRFYVEVQTSAGLLTDPPGGALTPYAPALSPALTVFADDFEFDRGWTGGLPGDTATGGQWVRVDPIGTLAQPADDHTPGLGTMCWVTGQGPPGGGVNTADVDDGFATLLSPRFDAAGAGSVVVSYWRWYDNSRGGTRDDPFIVQLSNDDGATWVTAETVGPTGSGTSGGWVFSSWNAATLLPMTDRVRVRFIAQDLGAPSTVEAAVDDFRIDRSGCANPPGLSGACCTRQGCVIAGPAACAAAGGVWSGAASACTPELSCCAANFNLMDGITVQDVYDYLEAWVAQDPLADFNGVGGVTVQDIYDFLEAWLDGCAG